jgi:hypothetical protein
MVWRIWGLRCCMYGSRGVQDVLDECWSTSLSSNPFDRDRGDVTVLHGVKERPSVSACAHLVQSQKDWYIARIFRRTDGNICGDPVSNEPCCDCELSVCQWLNLEVRFKTDTCHYPHNVVCIILPDTLMYLIMRAEKKNEIYRPSDRHLSAKLMPTFADRGCRVVRATDPYGRILGFLDRNRYFFFQVAPQLYSRGWVDPVLVPLLFRKSGSASNRTLTSGSVARNCDH